MRESAQELKRYIKEREMIKDIKTIISDTLLSWAISISPKERQGRLAQVVAEFLQSEIETFNTKEK